MDTTPARDAIHRLFESGRTSYRLDELIDAALAEDRAARDAEVRAAALHEAADELEGIDFHPNARSTCHGIAKAFAFRIRAKAAAARPDDTTGA
ncbi:hypothetical protein RM572_21810 [Streptomyces sp. DSM 42041]|uniref:Uncharacterized protein n=1 Tax=Streptomyces hazeniae TaxID=3075538 RepID=A0ABU2NYW7_9ACTN|nr:hypothetical protein [Streptomyces sp. DSM 42041]MDT0381398.1 hypothetical protein [Streptomyces sp. DSM 42041]